jgi:hypothetical protein
MKLRYFLAEKKSMDFNDITIYLIRKYEEDFLCLELKGDILHNMYDDETEFMSNNNITSLKEITTEEWFRFLKDYVNQHSLID